MTYSFKKYLKENVDTIHLPTGEDLSFMQDKQAVMFIANNGYFLFAQKQGNHAKVVVLKNVQKILEFTYDCPKTLIHAGMIEVLEDFKTFYATDKSLYEIVISFDEMDNVIEMSDSIVYCNFNESTGRVFPKGRAVAVRGKTLTADVIKSNFNKVNDSFGIESITDGWLFEESDERTGETHQKSFGGSGKEVVKSSASSKHANLFPELIMDSDWRNAVRVLGTGFVNNIETAKDTMDLKSFEKFMKNQLPKIKKASLQIGESYEL